MGGERFLTTLTRSAIIAGLLGLLLVLVLPRHVGFLWDFVDVFSVAFCFTFIGHYVEVFLLALPNIEVGAGRLDDQSPRAELRRSLGPPRPRILERPICVHPSREFRVEQQAARAIEH